MVTSFNAQMKKNPRILIVRSKYNDTKDMETMAHSVFDGNEENQEFDDNWIISYFCLKTCKRALARASNLEPKGCEGSLNEAL